MAQVAELSPSVKKLCQALKNKKILPISELGREESDVATLADALSLDLIQIGRQGHSISIDADGQQTYMAKVKKEKDGKTPLRDEHGRVITENKYVVRLDNDWSWMTAKNSETRVPLSDVIADSTPDLPPLHVRLTNAGLAASAGRMPTL